MNTASVQHATPTLANAGNELAHPPPGAAKWLAFSASPGGYLFALEHVGEVLPARTLTKIPFTQSWFYGALNVRGVLHSVVDLAAFLLVANERVSNTTRPLRATQPQIDRGFNHLVTINSTLNWPCALVVGALQGLRNPTDFPGVVKSDSAQSHLLVAIRRDTLDTQWLEVDVPALVASMRFRGIQA